MHLSMFSTEGGGGGWGAGGRGAYPGDWTAKTVTAVRNLTDDFGTGVVPWMHQLENLKEIMSKFEGMSSGFLTQNCVTWVGNFVKIV